MFPIMVTIESWEEDHEATAQPPPPPPPPQGRANNNVFPNQAPLQQGHGGEDDEMGEVEIENPDAGIRADRLESSINSQRR